MDEFIKPLAAQGPLVAAMCMAIWWLQSTLATKSKQGQEERSEIEARLRAERDARLTNMEEHIKDLEKRSRECESDRIELWKRLASANV